MHAIHVLPFLFGIVVPVADRSRDLDVRELGAERRNAARESGPFAATAKLYTGRPMPCTVLNMSGTGAKLRLVRYASLPKEFDLSIPARGASWRVRVVWQDGNELGVYRIQ